MDFQLSQVNAKLDLREKREKARKIQFVCYFQSEFQIDILISSVILMPS